MEQAFGLKMLKKKKHLLAYRRLNGNALRIIIMMTMLVVYYLMKQINEVEIFDRSEERRVGKECA